MSETISKPSEKNIQSVSQPDAVFQTQEKPQNQWVLQTPEYLLLIVIALILWTIGFIDVINRTSTNPTIFGLYSTAYFRFVVLYTLCFSVWFFLLTRPSRSGWLTKRVTTIQRTPWLAIISLGIIAFLMWNLISIEPQTAHPLSRLAEQLPVLRFIFVCFLLLIGLIFIFGGWTQVKPVQSWRKILAVLLAAVLTIELLLQILAAASFLPGTHKIADFFTPYGKVYYEGEGFANGRLNNFGWYYPDFNTIDESKRILIVGDTFIQALQIRPEQHLGVLLDEMITHDVEETQVMALGYPGFGPGLYLDSAILPYPVRSLNPDEIVAVVQLGSDLDNSTLPADSNIYFDFDEHGNAKVHPDNSEYWHDLAHFVTSGFQPLDPLLVLQANYLTPRLFGALTSQAATQQLTTSNDVAGEIAIPGFNAKVTEWGPPGVGYTVVKATGLIETPGASNYLFESQRGPKAEEALAITKSLIKQANDYAVAEDMMFRLVTIPAFPKAFYQEYKDEPWQPVIGNYDLFRPDRELQAFAENEGIPFLSMGQQMYDKNLPSDEIRTIFFSDGTGHLTPAGHQFLAEAIYECFYADQKASLDGGEVRHDLTNTTSCVN